MLQEADLSEGTLTTHNTFEEEGIRRLFMGKVYGILSVQFAAAVCVQAIFMFDVAYQNYDEDMGDRIGYVIVYMEHGGCGEGGGPLLIFQTS